MATLIRFNDLKTRGIVRNRMTLSRWIRGRGFPSGFMLGDNSRVWDEAEVDAWIEQQRGRTGADRPQTIAAE